MMDEKAIGKIVLYLLNQQTNGSYFDYFSVDTSTYDIEGHNYECKTVYEYDHYTGAIPVGEVECPPKERYSQIIIDGSILNCDDATISMFFRNFDKIVKYRKLTKRIFNYIRNAADHYFSFSGCGPTIFVNLGKGKIGIDGSIDDDECYSIDSDSYFRWEDDNSEETYHCVVDVEGIASFAITTIEEYYDVDLFFPVSDDFVFLNTI